MPINELLSKLGWFNLKERRKKQKALMMFKIMNGMTPAYLEDIFSNKIGRWVYNLRTSRWNQALPVVKTDYYRNSFAYTGAKVWNTLPDDMKCEKFMAAFNNKLGYLNLSIYRPSVRPSFRPFVCLSVRLSVYLSISYGVNGNDYSTRVCWI